MDMILQVMNTLSISLVGCYPYHRLEMTKSMDRDALELRNEMLEMTKSGSKQEVNLKPLLLDYSLDRISECAYSISSKRSENKSFFEAAKRVAG